MKVLGAVGTALLLLLLGMSVAVFAQEQRDEAKPQAQEEVKPKQEEEKAAKPEDKAMKQDKEEKKDENGRRQEQKNESGKGEAAQNDHAAKAAEHGEKGGRIPEQTFRTHFGREHRFRVGHPTVVGGRPQFEYGGYTFVMVNAWPAGWGYDDEVYVDYIDGVYYLLDPFHPGVQIVVNVVF